MKLQGLEDVRRKFEALGKKEAKQVTRKALRAGAKVIAPQIQPPERSGRLAKNIKIRAGKSGKGIISIIVGVGKKWFTGPAFYGGFVEFGHRIGTRRRNALGRIRDKIGLGRRKVEGVHFVQKGYDRGKDAALAKITETYKELLD